MTQTQRGPGLAQRLSTAGWWCVMAIVCIGPLATTNLTGFGISRYPYTYDQHFLVRAVLVAVLSFAALAFARMSELLGARAGRLGLPLIALGVFTGCSMLSTLLSQERPISILGAYGHYEGLITLWAYMALVVAVMQLVTGPRVRQLARANVVVGGLVGLHGVAQIAGLDPTKYEGATFTLTRSFASWGNPDFLGGYLVVPLVFTAVLALTEESRPWRWVSGMSFGVVLLALIGTVTRGAWIAGLAGLVVVAVALHRAGWRIAKPTSLAALVLPPIAFVALGGTHRVVNRIAGSAVTGGATPQDAGRLGIWRWALQVIREMPWLGSGPDTFEVTSAKLRVEHIAVSNDAHNHVLETAATVGVPAALALWGFFACVLLGRREAVLATERNADSALLVACWGAAAAELVHLLLGVSHTVSTALMLVCLAVLLRRHAREVRLPRAALTGSVLMAIVLTLGAAAIGARGIAADAEFMAARVAAHGGGGDRLAHARRAVELNPYYERYVKELAKAEAVQGAR